MSSVAEILQQMSETVGRQARDRGAIWGNVIQSASQVPGQILADQEKHALLLRQQAQQDATAGYARDANTRATKDQALQDAAAQRDLEHRRVVNLGLTAAMTDGDPSTFDGKKAFAAVSQAGEPTAIHDVMAQHEAMRPKPIIGKPGEVGINPDTNQPLFSIPEKPVAPTVASLDAEQQRILSKPEADRTPAEVASAAAYNARRTPPRVPGPGTVHDTAAGLVRIGDDNTITPLGVKGYHPPPAAANGGIGALYAATDPRAIAAQIRAHQMPPDITQYGRPVQGAIASVLAKTGDNGEPPFDLASAQRTWKAQLKLNATMNGGQQVRLDESIRSGLAMYDKIDELATQWDGMGIGPLSRANLAAAKNGLKGAAAASLANQLSGQIGQLTSDVATIEQGGLTPTNESRGVAEKSMQDWWGKGTIHDMTAQGRNNMQIRHLARNTQDVMVPGNGVDTRPALPATPAAPATTLAPPAAGRVRISDGNGHTGTILATDPVPAGWTKQ